VGVQRIGGTGEARGEATDVPRVPHASWAYACRVDFCVSPLTGLYQDGDMQVGHGCPFGNQGFFMPIRFPVVMEKFLALRGCRSGLTEWS
jgi:hypothetical protein